MATASPTPTPHRAFLSAFESDLAAGRARSLRDYLNDFPDADAEAIAIEILGRRDFTSLEPKIEDATVTEFRFDSLALSNRSKFGPYEIERELGRGGQGTVYLARDTRLRRPVALKVLDSLGGLSDDARQRFAREALVSSRLDHPAICTVYETGAVGTAFFIAMRYVPGESLKTMLRRPLCRTRGERRSAESSSLESTKAVDPSFAWDLPTLLALIETVARAVHTAHEASVIHRDLKPGNIVVTPEGAPVVVDFGLARLDDADGPTLTHTGDVFGTPGYMAPEQIAGRPEDVTRQCDVYALGVTLYECLTQRKPFEEVTREATYHAILTREPLNPQKVRPWITTDLRIVLETALAKEPKRRYSTADALANDLRALLEQRPIAARRTSLAGRLLRLTRREPAKAALALVLLLALPTIGALLVRWQSTRDKVRAAEAVEIADQRDAFLAEAAFAFTTEDPAAAQRAAERASALDPSSAEALANHALALLRLGKPEEVLAFVRGHTSEFAGRRAAFALQVEALRKLDRTDEADRLEAALPPAKDAMDHHLEGMRHAVLAVDGSHERGRLALSAFTRAVLASTGPRSLFLTERAKAAGTVNDRVAVEETADVLLAQWPDSPSIHFALSFAWERCGEWLRAAESAKEALRLRPHFPEASNNLGVVYLHQNQLDLARAEFEAALRGNPNLANAHTNLGNVLQRQGNLDSARASHEAAVRANPRSDVAYNNLGTVLRELGRMDEAIHAYRNAANLAPENHIARTNLGGAYLATGKTKEAQREFEAAISLHPTDAEVQDMVGRLKNLHGDAEGSTPHHREAVRLVPDFAEAHCNLGSALRKSGDLEGALLSFRRGHELGMKRSNWTFPTARFISECEHELAQAASDDSASTPELSSHAKTSWPGLAARALERNQPRRALSICRAVLAQDQSPRRAGHDSIHVLAARAAALQFASAPSDASATALLAEACAWMEEEAKLWKRAHDADRITDAEWEAALARWNSFPEFVHLPEAAAASWR